jgi:hypothetical protein
MKNTKNTKTAKRVETLLAHTKRMWGLSNEIRQMHAEIDRLDNKLSEIISETELLLFKMQEEEE